MKLQLVVAGWLIALGASSPALAQTAGADRPSRPERSQQQREEFHPQREFRREQEFQRRRLERAEGGEGRPGRMTPEERQQLRRDIREHGRDVYHDRPRRF
ncbi:MAG: hypothetical protein AMXMBFR31_13840 [Candidatus Desulfobacillus denitrificans]|jgi:hypothetical protein|uniref:Uncharacterized protein n=1 Tax=Candidatus Desulfobacillus denitrificans TaxID=2608985 RepID=A0A809RMJ7_9PROT|nr:hypothetical protein [Zoogloeaceae bacterium]MBP9652807.1 hypothetical protein [Rhodocyclaceae bacterium]BBO20752.1 conserved hypothetical protein [Candidatus Desulfobacillus denitrificans]GIK44321.1 MAG: hypothetical protein BroJett012_02240 [Betaproteobacteria bacterium]MCC7269414.1 hypothetical protein [Rhodocyclaceae bacterium]